MLLTVLTAKLELIAIRQQHCEYAKCVAYIYWIKTGDMQKAFNLLLGIASLT